MIFVDCVRLLWDHQTIIYAGIIMNTNSPRSVRLSIVSGKRSAFTCLSCIACATTLCVLTATTARADESANEGVKEFMKHPGVIFARELADVPGKNLVV